MAATRPSHWSRINYRVNSTKRLRTHQKLLMKALRVEKRGLALRNVEIPERGQEALVRVLLSGICNTDLEIARGYAGFKGTIGHEFVGVVEDSDNEGLIGQRVVGEISAGCGECDLCLTGDSRHCS